MSLILKILFGAVLLYGAIVVYMALNQRNLTYFPDKRRVQPANAGLAGFTEVVLDAADGERIVTWRYPAEAGKATILYFHGNAGFLADRADRFADMAKAGFGVAALSYRGYGGSSGKPTEAGLFSDALALFDEVAAKDAGPISVYGESLGAAIAVHVAANRPVAAAALEAPFTSAVEVGTKVYPWLPVDLLLLDRYESDTIIGEVTAPLVIIHGTDDEVLPFWMGEKLFKMANEPKTFVRVDGGMHNDIWPAAFSAARGVFEDGGIKE